MRDARAISVPTGDVPGRDVIVAPEAALAHHLATHVAAALHDAVAARGRAVLAVPGGSVATRLLPALGDAPVDWAHVDVAFVDERVVPADDPESNVGAARRGWLATPLARGATVHALAAAPGTVDGVAPFYAALPRLDVAVVGVGEDGHVASLFPGHAALAVAGTGVVAVADAPKPPPARRTLTLEALADARLACVAALGAAKAPVLAAALDDPASPLPVARLVRAATRCVVLLDADAATQRRVPR